LECSEVLWWHYLIVAAIVLVLAGAVMHMRRTGRTSTDDIYPMW